MRVDGVRPSFQSQTSLVRILESPLTRSCVSYKMKVQRCWKCSGAGSAAVLEVQRCWKCSGAGSAAVLEVFLDETHVERLL